MEKHKEYMVHIWGGAWNDDANPSIGKDLGIKDGYHYFSTEKEKDDFCRLLDNPIYKNQGLARDIKYGYMSHKRTIFVGRFSYKDKEFVLHFDFDMNTQKKVLYFSLQKIIIPVIAIEVFLLEKNMARILCQNWIAEMK